jgi:hypothetical protein
MWIKSKEGLFNSTAYRSIVDDARVHLHDFFEDYTHEAARSQRHEEAP